MLSPHSASLQPGFAHYILDRLNDLCSDASVVPQYQQTLHSALLRTQSASADVAPLEKTLPVLPVCGLCCEAAGGERHQAEALTAAWYLFYFAAHELDSVEDQDVDTVLLSAVGPAITLNVATGHMLAANLLLAGLEEAGVRTETAATIRRDFYRTGLHMCGGQHLDLILSEPSLEHCWQVAQAKSAAFFALACRSGARLTTDDSASINGLSDFGYHLGMLIQITDDVGGLQAVDSAASDLARGQWTLPVAYAMSVLNNSQRDLLRADLRAARSNAGARVAARQRVIASGAVLYLTIESERHKQLAEMALVSAVPDNAARRDLLSLLYHAAALDQLDA